MPRSESSYFIKVPGGHNKLLHSLQKLQNFPNFKLLPPQQVPRRGSFSTGSLIVQTQEQPESRLPADFQLHNHPPTYRKYPDGIQLSNLNAQAGPSLTNEPLDLGLSPPGRTFGSPLVGNQKGTRQSLNLNLVPSSPAWNKPSQNSLIEESQDLQSFNLAPSMHELNHPNEANLDLDLNGLLSGGEEMVKTKEEPDYQPQSPYEPPQATKFQTVFETPTSYSPENTSSSDPNQNPEKPGSMERRNADTIWSRVQNVKVKPLSRFVSSGHFPNQKPVIQQVNPLVSNTSQNATDRNTGLQNILPIRKVQTKEGDMFLKERKPRKGYQTHQDTSKD